MTRFDLKTWEGFTRLANTEPDYLIDTEAINARTESELNNPFRRHTMSFVIPKDMSAHVFEATCKLYFSRWMKRLDQEGWDFVSGFQWERGDKALDLEKGHVPNAWQYSVKGLFKKRKLEVVRIEVPPELVKRDPEHRITLQEAIKAR